MSNILPPAPDSFSEAAIFGRVVEGAGQWSQELAQHVLTLTISRVDRDRIEDLLERNAEGELSNSEQQELENFNHVADLISLWQSRARRTLNQS